MASFRFDQAEGLRRMLAAGGAPRILSVLSAASETEKALFIANLCEALMTQGSRVAVVDGCEPHAPDELMQQDLVLVDAVPDAQAAWLEASTQQHDWLLLASDGADSIKAAYGLLKRLQQARGRVSCALMVHASSAERADRVARNVASTASRYLALDLHCMGWLPQDEHVARALHLKRSVLDAFPLSPAAAAFRHLAAQLVERESDVVGGFDESSLPEGASDSLRDRELLHV